MHTLPCIRVCARRDVAAFRFFGSSVFYYPINAHTPHTRTPRSVLHYPLIRPPHRSPPRRSPYNVTDRDNETIDIACGRFGPCDRARRGHRARDGVRRGARVVVAAAPCWALYPGAIAGPVAQSHSRSRKRSARLTGAARRERSRIEDQKERERDRQTETVCQKVTVIAAALQGPRVVARGVRAV